MELGALISRVQGAVVAAGIELEKIISEKSKEFLVKSVEEMENLLTGGTNFNNNTYLIPKKTVQGSEKFKIKHEPDFLLLKKDNKTLYIVELKDGDDFDTKKSSGEVESLRRFQDHISNKITYKTQIIICCFNQDSKKEIIKGFKGRITTAEAFYRSRALRINWNWLSNHYQR
ncbi:MAG: hypothetical protein GBAus27B_000090 [Mycoplasmataceae bacterium]|nr:MAG: hypothetical protein GBAus27B_000090 [Mycoplasmataceae bacterium]